MAIYHLSAKLIKRSAGQSSTAAAAYRSGTRVADLRTGEVHDYRRKGGVDYSAVMAPSGAPEWAQDRAELWNEAELAEKRKDAQVAREIVVALPRELTKEQMVGLISHFVKSEFVSDGMVADINIHNSGSGNPHAHILLTTRSINKDGFGKKERTWNDKEKLEGWREYWALAANKALLMTGHEARIDHRSLSSQGIGRTPQIHLGKKNIERMKRGEINPRIEHHNAIKAENEYIQVTEEIDNIPNETFLRLEEETDFLIEQKQKSLKNTVSQLKNNELTAEQIKRRYHHAKQELEASRERTREHKADLKSAWLPLSSKANRARKGITKESAKQSSLQRIMRRLKDAWQAMRSRGDLNAEISVLEAIKAQIQPRLQRINAKNVAIEQQPKREPVTIRRRRWQDLEP